MASLESPAHLLLVQRKFNQNSIRRVLANRGSFGSTCRHGDFHIGASVIAYVIRHTVARSVAGLYGKIPIDGCRLTISLHHGEDKPKIVRVEMATATGPVSRTWLQ